MTTVQLHVLIIIDYQTEHSFDCADRLVIHSFIQFQ